MNSLAVATVTPEHTAACRELLMQYDGGRNRGPYTPPSEEGALVFPSTGGGTEFTGGTFDPSLGYYIINYADTGHISQLVKVEDDRGRRALHRRGQRPAFPRLREGELRASGEGTAGFRRLLTVKYNPERCSGEQSGRTGTVNLVHAQDQRTAPAISLQGLRRPLRAPEQCLFRGAGEYQELVDALGRLLEQDDDTDDQAVAMAEAMVSVLIYDAMTRRFFDRRSGALRQFADKLRKAVDSFEANIR